MKRCRVQLRDHSEIRFETSNAAATQDVFFSSCGNNTSASSRLKETSHGKQERTSVKEACVDIIEDLRKQRFMGAEAEQVRPRVSIVSMQGGRVAWSWNSPCRQNLECIEWYEVVKSMVFVLSAPTIDATRLGIVRHGQKIQVRYTKAVDEHGRSWVELTMDQLWRVCDSRDPAGVVVDSGFSLIDGSDLGLGPLLQGPLTRDEWPGQTIDEPFFLPHVEEGAQIVNCSIAPETEWFEVVSSTVFIRMAASSKAKIMGIARQGQTLQVKSKHITDADGQQWLELVAAQFPLSHCLGNVPPAGNAFTVISSIDDHHGKLLRGPLEISEIAWSPSGI